MRVVPRGSENLCVARFVAELIVQIARAPRLANFRAGERDRALQQIAFHNLIDDAGLERVGRADRIAHRAHLDSLRHTGQPRQTLRPSGTRDNSKLNFRLANLRRRNSHAIVARHGRFESTTQRRAVNGRDNGLRAIFHAIQNAHEAGPALSIATGSDLSKLANIGAGDESAPAANQHDGFHRVVFFELPQCRR